jgi:pimeloyl-ACP methyl ester carboxylesterase
VTAASLTRGSVVLVHGSLDDGNGFRRLEAQLPAWTTTSYDRHGWGTEAGDDADLGPGRHVADLAARLPERERTVLLGHSFGATIALGVAARVPERVRAVVAFEPPLPWLPWWPSRAPWEQLVLEAGDDATAAERLMRAVLGDAAWERLPAPVRARRRAEGPALRAEMRLLLAAPPAFDPLTLACRVMTVAGADSLPHHRATAAALAELLPDGSYHELPGAGHAAHVTHPAALAAVLDLLPEETP